MGENRKEKKVKLKSKFDYRSSRFFALILLVAYMVAVAVFCAEYSIIPGPEFIILAFLIYAAYNQRLWHFLGDWLPFITVFVVYETMYSIVGTVAQHNLHAGPYHLDLLLFGQLPSLVLQRTLRTPILDYLGAFFYTLHFFAPIFFAFVLWRMSRQNFLKYTFAFGICSFSALITFLFYAVAPPWIAVPSVTRILTGSVDTGLGVPVFKTLFEFLGSNLYAAFPSMHSALPTLILLFSLKIWKMKGFQFLSFQSASGSAQFTSENIT